MGGGKKEGWFLHSTCIGAIQGHALVAAAHTVTALYYLGFVDCYDIKFYL